jgi:hypothetical protein
MSFNANDVPVTSSIPPLDPGTYPARVVCVANLGLHAQEYQGKVKDPKTLIGMTYELLDEFLKDEDGLDLEDKPRFQSETFSLNNLSSDKAKSTLRYNALDPAGKFGGDFSQFLETPCMVSLIQKKGQGPNAGKTFNNVDGITSMRAKEAAKAPELVNAAVLFDFYAPSQEAWEALSPRFQKAAMGALDYPGSALEAIVEALGATDDKKVVKKEKREKFVAPVETSETKEDDEESW